MKGPVEYNGNHSIAGVDGCKTGWVIVSESVISGIAIEIVSCFSEVLNRGHQFIVVDIPVGLTNSGTRLADQQARRLLKNRACCVFTAPLRHTLTCANYSEARQHRIEIEGKSLTKQTWAIVPKIREVDALLSCEMQSRVREGHPEVSFAHMNLGNALSAPKHSAKGRQDRIDLLTAHFLDVPTLVQKHRRIAEDVVDGFAMLWTARRVYNKQALALPPESQTDSRGLLMQIWA
jgi:predicted RNase H-like nuclease